jgi:hypothetical protein
MGKRPLFSKKQINRFTASPIKIPMHEHGRFFHLLRSSLISSFRDGLRPDIQYSGCQREDMERKYCHM